VIEPLTLALSAAAASVVFGSLGALLGAQRGRARTTLDVQPRLDALERELRRSATRIAEAERRGRLAGEQLRAAAMATHASDLVPATYPRRPGPRELDGIAARLRGFAFLDAVVVADAAGLPLSRDETRASRELASLVPKVVLLESSAGGALDGIAAVSIVTRDARHFTLRRLPDWTGGAFLGAMAHSQAPAPLALDAAVAGAILARPSTEPREGAPAGGVVSALAGVHAVIGADRGANTRQLVGELERMTAATEARALAFGREGQVISGVLCDGPPESVVAALLGQLDAFTAAVGRALHSEIASIELTLRDGSVVVFAPLQATSRFALLAISAGRGLDPLEIDRLIGRIRRLLPPSAPMDRTVALPASAGGFT
jgi:hypothetical protein